MKMFKGIGVTGKLVTIFLGFALIPMLIIGASVLVTFKDIEMQAATTFRDSAITISDKIDRNLFERYGDVQAFALNRALYNRDDWYKRGTDIEQVMNQYVSTYGIYYLTILVDPNGKVIAVNSKDASGNRINTAAIYSKDYSGTSWFRALKAGNYTTKMPFTAKGNDISTGTYIEDLHIDKDVTATYSGDDGLALGFSAPVYHSGKVIAYWSNRTKFSLVEELFQQAYTELKGSGYPGAELTLLDKDGRVIVDYDPAVKGTTDIVHDLNKVIMKLNLAEKGVAAAQRVVNGESGYMYADHARKKITQAAGFSHLKGALGFPGMNWGVMVRVPESEAAPWLAAIQRNIILIIGVVALIVAGIGIWLGRRVVASILPVVKTAGMAANGDLTGRVNAKSKDEIGDMGNAFDTMLHKLTRVVQKVRSGAGSIQTASQEISTGNTDLSQRTEEQASSLEETASSMEEMTSTVKQNADNARQANQLANVAREQAEKGGSVVNDAVNAMGEINSSSKKIADIISVIDEIAFQTNLLALNAAVEAARAGEQGRGFAVVATEVRNLAQRSAGAAKEIKDLINDSVDKVKVGTDLVDKSGETLTEIVQGVKKVSDIVSEIAAASQEQSSGIDQINKAIMQMDEMTQQNAALVEEAASASKSMEEQAKGLNDVVAFFKIDEQTGELVAAPAQQPVSTKPKKAKARQTNDDASSKVQPELTPASKVSAIRKTGTNDGEWEEF